ncbi:putative bifunctional diguanylate cyclase/phosphodiesterase [Marinomonas ostreistagni]|uniref:EAL domain-containing protein n=1 Tax=Marinomonas ostreistagni TaxID=359209 RepID=A0ABS0ZEU7_9GAMM|nr:GGDEF domain-containing phosphodiesterase [Marinomonas ostreistagni]MBJ7552196.1 EAL domain-containing protein [Marinomonas ostreistagni]
MEPLHLNVPFTTDVMDMFRDAVVITDAEGIILKVNQTYQDISGYSEAELIGQRPAKVKSGRHGDAFYQAMWQDLKTIGYWEGEIWDRRKNAEVYPKWLKIQATYDSQGNISHYVGVFYETKNPNPSLHERERLANIDPLTGLCNRSCYRESLTNICHHVSSEELFIQLYLDIDKFKDINEKYGYVVGDDLLTMFADRVRRAWHEIWLNHTFATVGQDGSELLARFSGDEFLMGFRLLKSAATNLDQLLHEVTQVLNMPYKVRGHVIQICCSVGMAQLFIDASNSDELIAHAEAAMYVAKQAGGDRTMLFTQSIKEQLERRKLIEQSLIAAIAAGQFELYYQPKVGGLSRQVCGYEALVRWNHPQLGILSPSEFIPIAEETGAILPLGDWVMEHACLHAKELNDLGFENIPVAINVSASQLSDPDWLDRLLFILQKTKLPTHLIELELTESQLLVDIDHSTDLITYIRSLGVKVALDDFGTGYSSLSYLRNLPLDTLKIDRSFVAHLQENQENYDLAIIKAVKALSKQLGISLVAEGVEKAMQERILTEIGCDQLQGYLYSKPIPAKEFLALCLRSLTEEEEKFKSQ